MYRVTRWRSSAFGAADICSGVAGVRARRSAVSRATRAASDRSEREAPDGRSGVVSGSTTTPSARSAPPSLRSSAPSRRSARCVPARTNASGSRANASMRARAERNSEDTRASSTAAPSVSSSPRIRLRLRVGARSRVTRRHAWVTWRRISCPPRLPRRRRPPPRRRRRARARSSGGRRAPGRRRMRLSRRGAVGGSRSRRVAVHLRQKTSPQHLQWCRLLMRVNSDAHAGLAHAGASASGTQWDRSTRRGPMASRTRSTTSARREGTRAREAARRGGSCSSGVLGRAGESSDASGEGGSDVDDVAASRGTTPASWSVTRPACARKSSPRATRRACAGWRRRTSCLETRGVGNARGERPSRGWKCLRATLAPPPRTARLPRRSPPPAVAASQTEKSNHPCWTL